MQGHKGTQRRHHRLGSGRKRKGPQRNSWSYIFILAIIFCSTLVFSQQKKIKTVEVSDTIAYAYVDRPGDLYIITLGGQLQRFDKDGRLSHLYRKGPSLSLFDPRDGARLFAYYRDKAQYDFLNPSFEVVSSYKIDSAFALNPWMVCASGDHNVWALDASDWSLKKIDMRTGAAPVEVTLSFASGKAKTDIVSMREYQNFVFLLDKKAGILIYSNMGKLLKTIPVANLRYFNFIGEDLYYLVGDTLKFMNLFTTETREMKLPTKADLALLTDERLFVIRKNVVDIFEVK